jgi:cytochrome c oxidase subunit IV
MRTYWITWAALLVFTMLMLWADGASQSVPRLAFVMFMLGAMLVKATLIGANFMHLRFERASLVITVVVGLLVTGTLLYVLIAPDAARIHGMGSAW